MRTTVTISDELLDRLRREARRSRRPFKVVLNEALRLGVDRLSPPPRRRAFRQRTFRMGHPPAIALDKALQLAVRLEDDEISRKLALGK
jgi:hypothetical protein